MTMRILKVLGGLAAAGAVVGALAGVATAGLFVAIADGSVSLLLMGDIYGFAARVGAVCGTVLAPTAAFAFMRRVPLGKLFAQTAAATVAAGVVGVWVATSLYGMVGIATLGFLAAGTRLAFVHRDATQVTALRAGDGEIVTPFR